MQKIKFRGYRPIDKKWYEMEREYYICLAAGIPIPKRVANFFKGGCPRPYGEIYVDLGEDVVSSFAKYYYDGYTIEIAQLPEDIDYIRFDALRERSSYINAGDHDYKTICVFGWRPMDQTWKKMREVWYDCINRGVNLPREVIDFFQGKSPDEDFIVNIDYAVKKHSEVDGVWHYEINLTQLRGYLDFIRVSSSY